jgi:hypothetical protein
MGRAEDLGEQVPIIVMTAAEAKKRGVRRFRKLLGRLYWRLR